MPRDKVIGRYPYHVFGFDIETTGLNNDFILACITDGTDTYTFRDPIACVEALMSDAVFADARLIATNLKFDFFGTISEWSKVNGTEYITLLEKDGRIYSAELRRKDRSSILFLDTLNYYPTSVEVLGEIIRLEKMEHPSFFPNRPKDEDEWTALTRYCENDALISKRFFVEFVVEFCHQWQIDVPLTTGSIALHIIQTHFMDRYYRVPEHEEWMFIHESFCGGHTEVIRRGKIDKISRCYDVNSMYPYVMSARTYPDPNYAAYTNHSSENIIRKYHGFSYVELDYPSTVYLPCLPVKIHDKLLFPTGLIKGVFTHIELRQALADGAHIHKFGKSIYYTRVCQPFTLFINHFYRLRKEYKKAKNPLEVMIKLVMNASYGKWGFNYTESSQIITQEQLTEEVIMKAKRVTTFTHGFFGVTYDNQTNPPQYALIMWASYVTAYARLHLLEHMRRHADHLLYVDTDSLYLMDGHDPIPDSVELGGFKLEKEAAAGTSIFVAPKHYKFDHTLKIKGVRLRKIPKQKNMPSEEYAALIRQIESENEKDFLSSITKQKIHQQQFASHRRALRSKPTHKWGELTFNQIMSIDKILKNEDTKRRWSTLFCSSALQDSTPHVLTADDWKEMSSSLLDAAKSE